MKRMRVVQVSLVIADVDGTLVTKNKVLTDRARAAVRRLRDAGIAFAITSGRPPRGMAMLVEPLGLTTPVAAFNGGMLVAPDLTTVHVERVLSSSVSEEVVAHLLARGLDAWVYTGTEWFVRDREAPHVAREQSTVRFPPTVTPDLLEHTDAGVKIVGVSDDLPLVARCEAELRDVLGARASAARSQPVRELSRRLSVPLPGIATIG
ncbi:MAG: HAD hydrolase family protein, partial [Planctomycetota bacterium]